ncbi:MAG: hypothetical protein DRJ66_07385 [Thermoprotei archaeon]|nr:MAG: hypothetical protein DRJ66_07385 [Thermoprotei archaeon]RLF17878.1 MAG: hypothetical protein DRZ82_09295 [Thermoprotei archaeon]
MLGVLDACFIIDWSRYRRRKLLSKLFDIMYIHEEVLAQIRSTIAIEYVTELMMRGILRLYAWSDADETEFIRLRDDVSSDPRIPAVERPDILCLIIAKALNAILLSENVGIHRIVEYNPRYRNVSIWTALEVLENMVYKGLITIRDEEEFLDYIREYEEDTAHKFRRRRIEECIERLREWLRK